MTGRSLTASVGAPDQPHRVSSGNRKSIAIVFGAIAAIVLLVWVSRTLARWSGGRGGDGSD